MTTEPMARAEPRPSELCLNCGGYVDAMNGDAIGRFKKDGTEMTWCGDECFVQWCEKQPAKRPS